MPFGDGTGPMGLGPMTGRRAGYCAGFGAAGFAGPMHGYRHRHGHGHRVSVRPRGGYGYGFGRGWRGRGPYGHPW